MKTYLPLSVAFLLALTAVVISGPGRPEFEAARRNVRKADRATDSNVSPSKNIEEAIEEFRSLDKHRDNEEWASELPANAGSRPVAFSVSGDRMHSKGNETVINYATTLTNTQARAWVHGGSHFRAPVTGLYLFTVSFTNEQSYGSSDEEVYVTIRKNGALKGFAFVGEGGSFRETGSYTVALDLARDDVVHTGVVDDFKGGRYLRFFNFTGVLVQPSTN